MVCQPGESRTKNFSVGDEGVVLVLRLEGSDLLGTAHFDADSDFGSHTIMQTNRMDTQRVRFFHL